MQLTDVERAMLEGARGKAVQKAMELLVRYARALNAERFVETTNIAGVPGAASRFLQQQFGDYDAIFSHFDLDSDELIEVPRIETNSCHLQGGYDPENWQTLGATAAASQLANDSEVFIRDRGVKILKTCTPYLAGNVPRRGEHCAWMESSAVVYCNSVLGARTNTEGRESTSAAMLTGRIPDWGLHREASRAATHLIEVDFPVESVMDWGMLGYFVGNAVGERVPVLSGASLRPDVVRHKHFGAAAASSGGVEMYHVAGVTPEAPTLSAALGAREPVATIRYGISERRAVYEDLNSRARDREVDYVMLGCPHAALEQLREAAGLLAGRKISASTRMWIFTSRAIKAEAVREGLGEVFKASGVALLTDTCSAIAQAIPPGTKVVALDSAKQTHYLPAMMGIQAWFGSTADCVNAALTGRWNGELR